MAEQTERAFLKQPKVFLSSKKSGKGKRPGKGGNRFWKNIGLGFKTPKEAVQENHTTERIVCNDDTAATDKFVQQCMTPGRSASVSVQSNCRPSSDGRVMEQKFSTAKAPAPEM